MEVTPPCYSNVFIIIFFFSIHVMHRLFVLSAVHDSCHACLFNLKTERNNRNCAVE